MILYNKNFIYKNLRTFNCYKYYAERKISKSVVARSEEYQFIQRSKLPMMHFQRSLPRLPIPLLEKTCERFLSAIYPITTTAEYDLAQNKITEFRHGIGMELHAQLRKIDNTNKHTSYISEPWFDMYLSDRAPLPLNYNPVLVMKNETRLEYKSQIVRATNLVISSLRFYKSMREGFLKPEIYHLNPTKSDTENFQNLMRIVPKSFVTYAAYFFKAFPLDMSQYNRLFGVSRIPLQNKDRLVQMLDSRHILVFKRGNIYAVDVLNKSADIEQPDVIFSRLQAVVHIDNERNAAQVPIGVLTTGNRNSWAKTRNHLLNGISKSNKQLLEKEIDAALFCLCLDDTDDHIKTENGLPILLKQFLAGDGKNRWFDKSFSLLVDTDGTTAVNFEHSWGDGVAVLRYFNEIYKDSIEHPRITKDCGYAPAAVSVENVRSINFDIDERLVTEVSSAVKAHADIVQSLNINILKYPYLNKITCKHDGISPDSIMQLAFQLAYRRAFNCYVGTYESCSTAAFRHGRTETVRPCTAATKNFCEAILLPSNLRPKPYELRKMIDICSAYHGKLIKEAAMGQGFDRHLFALKNLALQQNMPLHDFYNTAAYKKINYNILSTSTLSSNALLAGAFGPVIRNGLGIGYSIHDDECGAVVSSYDNQCNGKYFVECLEEAFNLICDAIAIKEKN